jgi:hypothetical protein
MGARLGMFAARDLSGIQESPLDVILGAGAPRYPMDERPPSPAPVQIGGAKGGGFFAPGGTGRAIVGNIGDALLRLSGGAPVYGPAMQHQRDFQDRLKLAEMQRQQAMQDWQTKYNYEIANPKPINNDTVADYQFIAQNLGADAAKDFLKNKANPPVYRVGPDGQFYRVDTAQPPSAPVGKLTPIPEGGAGGNVSGGFPDPMKAPGHMTSGRRTPEGNRLVGGTAHSHHLTGDAADYTGASIDQ